MGKVILDHVTMSHATKCETCGMCWLTPSTVCHRCKPEEHREEYRGFLASATVVRAVYIDLYESLVAVDALGNFFHVRDARQLMYGLPTKHLDTIVSDLTAMKTESTELLAENARLRRRLEKKT